MKRYALTVVMTAALGVGAYTLAGAQGPGRQGWGAGPDGRGGPGRGSAMLMLRGVELSDTQREQLRAIREAHREAPETFAAQRELHRQLRTEILADVPDVQKLAELQRQLTEAQAARMARQVEVSQQIAQVLTPEQRNTLRERMAQAPAGRGPAGRRGQQ